MYLHIGGEVIVPLREIVGVFRATGKPGEAKSFILMRDDTVYLSNISVTALRRRWQSGDLPFEVIHKPGT
jgi:hypothetical protein